MGEPGWQILAPDDPVRWPAGYAVVTGDWTSERDRAEHYVAEGMTIDVAEVLVAALVGRDARDTELDRVTSAYARVLALLEAYDGQAMNDRIAARSAGDDG